MTLYDMSMGTQFLTGRLVVVLFALSVLTACVGIYHHSYPEKWEAKPSIAENDCTDIAGDYDVRGFRGNGEPGPPLTQFFLKTFNLKLWGLSRLREADHLKIEQGTETLKLSAWKKNLKLEEIQLKKQSELNFISYVCTSDGVIIRGESPTVHGLAGLVIETLTLFKLSDGSLVIRNTDTGGGLALVVPVYMNMSDWNRYKPFSKPASPP